MSTKQRRGQLPRAVVAIPALDPEASLPGYVRELLDQGVLQVVVVDDGSRPDRQDVFTALEAVDGCTVLRHEKNRGKGGARRTASPYRRGRGGWGGALWAAADADGQHTVEDVCAVARAAAEETDKLVMGVRDLGLEHVPVRSKMGNRVTSWAFHLLYGVRLADTQTGLRGVPWDMLEWCLAIGGERFEYEMNMLIKAARERVGLRQVSIQVIYFDNNAGSHLRTVRDAWRVFLVLISGLGWYTMAAALSAAADVLSFWLCSAVIFRPLTDLACYWWSTLTARALSSSINYTLNRRYVFGSRPRKQTMARYYCLWLGQLVCSYLLLLVITAVFPALPPVIGKALADILLAIFSYQIQLRWVFREEDAHEAG